MGGHWNGAGRETHGMTRIRLFALVLIATGVVATLASGCGGGDDDGGGGATITADGSSTVGPFVTKAA